MRKRGRGLSGEYSVAENLIGYGRKVVRCAAHSPFDLVVDGYRVEVKCAGPRSRPKAQMIWTFNIHRHGVLSEQTDLYICRLEGVPYSKAAIHMLFKAPLGVKTLLVSMRSLLNQDWAAAVADFYALAKGEYARKEFAA